MSPVSLRVSIRSKLAVPIVGAILALGVGTALGVRRSVERSLEEELHRRSLALVSSLALQATRETVVEDLAGLERVIADVMAEDDVLYVVIIGSRGFVLADSFPAGVPTDLIGIFETPRDVIHAAVPFRTEDGPAGDYVAQMLDGRLGTVHLGVRRDRIQLQAQQQGRLVLALACSTALAAALVAWLVAHLVARPMRRLSATASRVGAGDLTARSGVVTGDEVGELAAQFDEMVQQLADGQQAVERAHRAMVRSERMAVMGTVAAGVAHEIGNPLHAARQFAEALEENPDAGERYLPLVQEALGRIDKVIAQMMAYSRERQMQLGRTDIGEVVGKAVDFAGYDRRWKDVALQTTIQPEIPPAHADPDVLGQVLVNLLVNALDAVEPGGTVRVVAAAGATPGRGAGVTIAVEDDGPGVPPELRDRVFEPFFTSKAAGHGTGLGLSVSQELMAAQGGRLDLVERQGPGAVFRLWLPAAEDRR